MQRLANEPSPTWGSFNGDYFHKKQFAEKLHGLICDLNVGAVITIDENWGSGKTWFAKHFNAYLKSNQVDSVYFDAFERDYEDEPLSVFSELIIPILFKEEQEQDRVNEKAAKIIQLVTAPVSLLAKFGVTFAASSLSAQYNEPLIGSGAIVNAASAEIDRRLEQGQKYICQRLKQHSVDSENIASFRNDIRSALERQQKPLVVIIDELDRCKPTYAIKVLEVLKHFFDCPGLIFLLMINGDQISSSIKGVYGQSIDASLYLNKFVRLRLRFPTFKLPSADVEARMEFVRYTLPEYKKGGIWTDNEVSWLGAISYIFDLSLREIQRVVDLLMFSQINICRIGIYFACLKTSKLELYNRLRSGDNLAHEELREFLFSKRSATPGFDACSHLCRWHNRIISVSGIPIEFKKLTGIGDITQEDIKWLIGHDINDGDGLYTYVSALMDQIDSELV